MSRKGECDACKRFCARNTCTERDFERARNVYEQACLRHGKDPAALFPVLGMDDVVDTRATFLKYHPEAAEFLARPTRVRNPTDAVMHPGNKAVPRTDRMRFAVAYDAWLVAEWPGTPEHASAVAEQAVYSRAYETYVCMLRRDNLTKCRASAACMRGKEGEILGTASFVILHRLASAGCTKDGDCKGCEECRGCVRVGSTGAGHPTVYASAAGDSRIEFTLSPTRVPFDVVMSASMTGDGKVSVHCELMHTLAEAATQHVAPSPALAAMTPEGMRRIRLLLVDSDARLSKGVMEFLRGADGAEICAWCNAKMYKKIDLLRGCCGCCFATRASGGALFL